MPKKSDIPYPTLSRLCPLCGKRFIVPHPKNQQWVCDECIGMLKEIVNERRQSGEQSDESDGKTD